MSSRRREVWWAYGLMAPAVVLMVGVMAYPVGWEAWVSLTDLSPLNDGPAKFVGLENYRRLAGDAQFWRLAGVTVACAAVPTAVKLAVGVGFARLLARPFRGRALVFLAIFLPWAYPASVSVIGWYWTLNPPIPTAYSAFMSSMKASVDHALGSGAW